MSGVLFMKYRFLCGPYRIRISQDSDAALHAFDTSFEAAQTLYEAEQLRDAIPFAGGAFEIAEVILSTKAAKAQLSCEMFSQASVLFAQVCAASGCEEQAHEIYRMAMNRLERELALSFGKQPWLVQQLEFFYQGSQTSDTRGREQGSLSLFSDRSNFYSPSFNFTRN